MVINPSPGAMSHMEPTPPLTIGWKEYIDLPDWDLRHVKVKIDTGARTAALGATGLVLSTDPEGQSWAELLLRLFRRHPEQVTTVRVPVLGQTRVRNTGGCYELRPLIETTFRIGPVVKRVRLTVADRSRMLFPIILGRKILEGDFLIDPGRKYLLRSVK
jgi:hypothetical protein